ncbi:MAG: Ger(x)C family spore germination protein [Ruminococcaceae bacterium]|nr:Ger(x)C family spore germination protein [Oscillospiraceae bacterium]
MTDNKLLKVFKWIFFVTTFLLLLFVIVFLFTGCVDKQELDELTVVSGIAVDEGKSQDGGQVPVLGELSISVEFVTVSSEGTTGKDVKGKVLNLHGKNAFSALRSAMNISQNKLYLSHNQILIFGRKLAEKGLNEHIDFFIRDYEARLNVPLLIADGEAGEILQTKPEGVGLISEFLNNMANVQSVQGLNVNTKMFDLVTNISSWEKGTLIPLVKTSKEGEKTTLKIDETAAFVGDTMVGTLDGGQTRGVLWVMGLAKDGLINIETSQGQVVVEITGSKVDKKVEYKDKKLKVKIDILQSGVVGSATNGAGYNYDKNIEEIQNVTEKAIVSEIKKGYKKLAELGCDVYGFGDWLRRNEPDQWKEVVTNWDKFFKNIDFTIEVKSTIDNTGALRKDI